MGTLQHTYAHQQQRYISQCIIIMHPKPTHMYMHMYTIAKPTDQAYLIDMGRVHEQLGKKSTGLPIAMHAHT